MCGALRDLTFYIPQLCVPPGVCGVCVALHDLTSYIPQLCVPPAWEVKNYPDMWDHTYANMLNMLDSAVSNVTQALKQV
jgi:hypothetical protein